MHPIYLDHNATTPLDPEVLEAMRPHLLAGGQRREPARRRPGGAAGAGSEARETVARILGADPAEVIFTSGGTEANNLAVFGLAGAERRAGARRLQPDRAPGGRRAGGPAGGRRGSPSTGPPVDAEGLADADAMAAPFRAETRLAT